MQHRMRLLIAIGRAERMNVVGICLPDAVRFYCTERISVGLDLPALIIFGTDRGSGE